MTEQTINDMGMSYIPGHSIVRRLLGRYASAKFAHMVITKVTAPEHFELLMQDAHLLSITKYTLVKCVTCRAENHEKFVSSKVTMVMLNG